MLEEKLEAKTKVRKELAADYMEIDSMGQSTLLGKVQFSSEEADRLKGLAKEALLLRAEIDALSREPGEAKKEVALWKSRYERLLDQGFSGRSQACARAGEKLLSQGMRHGAGEEAQGQATKPQPQTVVV